MYKRQEDKDPSVLLPSSSSLHPTGAVSVVHSLERNDAVMCNNGNSSRSKGTALVRASSPSHGKSVDLSRKRKRKRSSTGDVRDRGEAVDEEEDFGQEISREEDRKRKKQEMERRKNFNRCRIKKERSL